MIFVRSARGGKNETDAVLHANFPAKMAAAEAYTSTETRHKADRLRAVSGMDELKTGREHARHQLNETRN